ncbi:MAG: SOS response-associated peptidase [Candidatus Doudnabacteria bacterium]|nr:SOS response-associated peptidase [Candidatus Doudnabacteria bacterium]
MCGRFTLEPTAKFYERFQIENRLDRLVPRYNIAPGQQVPVVISRSPNRVLMMHWGLIPHWAKDPKVGYKMINARIETVAEKPSYRSSVKAKRCLIPASGFYEWHKSIRGKEPHFIGLKDEKLFGFAGLYDIWKNEKGEEVYSFTIITRPANKFMAKLHDRMPVILYPEHEAQWLNKNITDPNDALMFLEPTIDSRMFEYTVSALVNKPENDSPEIIKPIKRQ